MAKRDEQSPEQPEEAKTAAPEEETVEAGEPEAARETAEAPAAAGPEQAAETSPVDEELAQMREALLRTRAEMDNLQKRSERELEKSRKFILERMMRDLLPVLDGLDQGLENGEEADASREGLELTRKLLLDTLGRHGLSVVEPAGETFDPQWHEAISMQPTDEAEPDTVVTVLQKGYCLHERLLRPARVIVARAAD